MRIFYIYYYYMFIVASYLIFIGFRGSAFYRCVFYRGMICSGESTSSSQAYVRLTLNQNWFIRNITFVCFDKLARYLHICTTFQCWLSKSRLLMVAEGNSNQYHHTTLIINWRVIGERSVTAVAFTVHTIYIEICKATIAANISLTGSK